MPSKSKTMRSSNFSYSDTDSSDDTDDDVALSDVAKNLKRPIDSDEDKDEGFDMNMFVQSKSTFHCEACQFMRYTAVASKQNHKMGKKWQIGNEFCISHHLYCGCDGIKCSLKKLIIPKTHIVCDLNSTKVWELVDIASCLSSVCLVFHNDSHHIEITKRQLKNVSCWNKANKLMHDFSRGKDVTHLSSTILDEFSKDRSNINYIQSTLHKYGTDLYSEGKSLANLFSKNLQRWRNTFILKLASPLLASRLVKNNPINIPFASSTSQATAPVTNLSSSQTTSPVTNLSSSQKVTPVTNLASTTIQNANPLLKKQKTQLQTANPPPLPPNFVPAHYYFLKGVLVDPEFIEFAQDATYYELILSDGTKWSGFFQWHKDFSQSDEPCWLFFTILDSGHVVRESKQLVLRNDRNQTWESIMTSWKLSQSVRVQDPTDFFFHFDETKFQVKAGTVSLQNTHDLVQAYKDGKCILLVGDFLITLIGKNPISIRILGDNLSFVTHPLTCLPVIERGFLFDTNVLGGYVDPTALAKDVFNKIRSKVDLIRVTHNGLIELNATHYDFIQPYLELFWKTASTYQKACIKNIKAYYIHSPDIRNIFTSKCNMLESDGVSIDPIVTFHGIRANSKDVLDAIIRHGYQSEGSETNVYGSGGTYVAEKVEYCLSGYIEHKLGESNLGNYIIMNISVPGRALCGKGADNKKMGRKQESWETLTPLSKIRCIKDACLCPVVVFLVD